MTQRLILLALASATLVGPAAADRWRKPARVDVLTSIDAIEFADAWPDRITVKLEGLEIPVIGRAALIANKRATGRPQDLLDVAKLEAQ